MAKAKSEQESPNKEQVSPSESSEQEGSGHDNPGDAGTGSLFAYADELAGDGAGDEQEQQEESDSWVSFRLAGAAYGLKVEAVREVLRVEIITAVPHTPPHVRGVTNMRGRVLPVVDLRQRLGFDRAPVTETSRILVVRQGSEPVGLLVDAVDQILQVLASTIQEPPEEGDAKAHRAVTGMAAADSGVVVLLDPRALLDDLEPSP